MDVFETILKRRTIRSFSSKPIEKEKLEKILEAGRWAPSAGNLQDWAFIVVDSQEIKEGLWRASFKQNQVKQAPLVIVVCSDLHKIAPYGERGTTLYTIKTLLLHLKT